MPVKYAWGHIPTAFEDVFHDVDTLKELPPDLPNTTVSRGKFGSVYSADEWGDKVLKIVHHSDPGYQTWIEFFVLDNQQNPHVPRIYAYRRFTNGRLAVVMEKLAPLSTINDEELHGDLSDTQIFLGLGATGALDTEEKEASDRLLATPAWQDIITFLRNCHQLNDVAHSDNAMLRYPHTLVITDPLFV